MYHTFCKIARLTVEESKTGYISDFHYTIYGEQNAAWEPICRNIET